ncbi:MAG: alanine--tRNA ligase [Bacteroidetes bacterium]|nr:alanine--tRNA ligase [Bacteroidota bacterium]MBM3424499.1 alanine--tRNA ligase [Bacteroidota bacterium]
MTVSEIRQRYFDFFEKKGHKIVSSAPIVIKNDPTLLFTNAGMNQFKDYFLGNYPAPVPRIANSQKCLRVSGKHNDLEEVGVDTYHHTLFEMLGNWSFGDYFKEEAIDWAWELLTNEYQLNPKDLYITVFEGDPTDQVPADNESREFWLKYVDPAHILMASKKDNFWEMGDTGPCGPCTEIHIDLRSEEDKSNIPGASLVNKDHPQVIEIWNLVFMQFNRKANGNLEPLPQTHVDTGMGLERLAMALQGKQSNYDTDLFQALIQHMVQHAGKAYGTNESTDIALRVIADHVRAIAFSIADGQLPSNSGAGYVIRRILRRAVRYGYQNLELNEPFLCGLVPVLIEQMGLPYPELTAQEALIVRVIREEELSFFRTLEQGIKRMDLLMNSSEKSGRSHLEGSTVFELYDTYGFPVDLIQLIARENSFSVDEAGFNAELLRQKERSRAATGVLADDWQQVNDEVTTEFVGYDALQCRSQILRYRKVNQKNRTFYQIVLDSTPFYAESGGQVGDTGWLVDAQGHKTPIFDVKKENNLTVHLCESLPNNLDHLFEASVDPVRRNNLRKNHSATHLLHHALRQVLGNHVEQKGSLVSPEYLRFDFSHFAKVSDEELRNIINLVEAQITANTALKEHRNMPLAEAQAMGAMALFGEKYGETVRVVQFGESMELCGGTHVNYTGEIGLIKVQSESAVAAGIRRIEMITGSAAEQHYKEETTLMASLRAQFKNPKDIMKSIQDVVDQNQALTKDLELLTKERNKTIKQDLKTKLESVDGMQVLCVQLSLDSNSVKDILFQLKGEIQPFVGIVGNIEGDKCGLSVMIDEGLLQSKGWNAVQWIREVAPLIQGGGGGQPFFATAGGKNPNGIAEALSILKQKL